LIQVNLLPGAVKKAPRKGGGGGSRASFLPKFGKLPKADRWVAFIVAAWVLGVGGTAWMFWSTKSAKDELTLSLEQATRDSAHYATEIAATQHLQARRDSIAQKLVIIQDIDSKRYMWSHILDEVSRAVPDYTWLTGMSQLKLDSAKALPFIHIEGKTGTTLALTKFMQDLEASPFISNVTLASTEQIIEDNKPVYEFRLDAKYEEPPAGVIETVPLFKAQE
jgi:Tfp pilus assembly protein PilN